MMDFLESKAQVKVAHLIISSSSAWHPTRPSTMVESVRLGHWNIWGMLGPAVTEMPVKHLHDGPPARSLKEQLSRADSCREVGPRPLLVSHFVVPLSSNLSWSYGPLSYSELCLDCSAERSVWFGWETVPGILGVGPSPPPLLNHP